VKIQFDKYIIYKVTNLSNKKVYIGKTSKQLEYRKSEHICSANRKTDTSVFHKALHKYGINSFKWEIIFKCDDPLILNIMETFKIMVCHSHISEKQGYNMTWGGEGTIGYKFTEEQLKTLRECHLGIKQSTETKEKRRLKMKGKNKRFGNENNRYGTQHTEKTKQKMSESHTGIGLGKKQTEETKNKISKGNRKYSDEIMAKALKSITNGQTVIDVSKSMNIPRGTIYSWYSNQRGCSP
jgi:group I intron endonuclease